MYKTIPRAVNSEESAIRAVKAALKGAEVLTTEQAWVVSQYFRFDPQQRPSHHGVVFARPDQPIYEAYRTRGTIALFPADPLAGLRVTNAASFAALSFTVVYRPIIEL